MSSMYLDKQKLSTQLEVSQLTIHQVASKSKLSLRCTYYLFNKHTLSNPTLSTLRALSQALGCKPTQLLSE